MTSFTKWIDTFLSEKGIDLGQVLEVEGKSGLNCIPLECLVDTIKTAPAIEQAAIRNTIVKIDFMNGDVIPFFRHLARAIAL